MITHEVLMLAIQTKWPQLVHGQDYVVGHPIDEATGFQCGDAYIFSWKAKIPPKPDAAAEKGLLASALQLQPQFNAARAKTHRDSMLAQSDWTQLPDAAIPANVKAAWATYRQALRDVTDQPGFPDTITWPVMTV
jgi:hypothetical protein